jgi:hypothetical protein
MSSILDGAWESTTGDGRTLGLFAGGHHCVIHQDANRVPVISETTSDEEALRCFRGLRAHGGPCTILEEQGNRVVFEITHEYARVPRPEPRVHVLEMVVDGDIARLWALNPDRSRVEGSESTWRRLQ